MPVTPYMIAVLRHLQICTFSLQYFYLFGGVQNLLGALSFANMARHIQFNGNILGDCPWKDSEQVWNMNTPVLSTALLIGHCGKGFYTITLKMSRNMGIQKQHLPNIKPIFTNFHPEKKNKFVLCILFCL